MKIIKNSSRILAALITVLCISVFCNVYAEELDIIMTPEKLKEADKSKEVKAPEETKTPAVVIPAPEPEKAPANIVDSVIDNKAPDQKKDKRNPLMDKPLWSGSILFDQQGVKKIQDARAAFLRGGGTKAGSIGELLEAVGGVAAQEKKPEPPKQIVAPQIFLDSIAYFSPDSWIIWVNGTKLTKGQSIEGFTVARVTTDKVSLVWDSSDFEKIVPGWREMSQPASNPAYRFIKSNRTDILIDVVTKKVIFNLYPNQTFVSRNLEIMEGRASDLLSDIVPVIVQNN